MRSFFVACLVAVAIATGSALVLNTIIQKSASTAFSTTGVRI